MFDRVAMEIPSWTDQAISPDYPVETLELCYGSYC